MQILCSEMSSQTTTEEKPPRGRLGRRSHKYHDDSECISKNLHAERRRRQKLSDRLLTLRSLVPNITNMNKAMIIEDAITYIEELQNNVKALGDELLEMEANRDEGAEPRSYAFDSAEEMKSREIKEDVKVTKIDGNKLWLKTVYGKERGRFTKLMEALNHLGLEVTDITVTTPKGATLVSCCVKGICGHMLEAHQTEELLLELFKCI